MSAPAIRVENLGKRYHLGVSRHGAPYRTLREELAGSVRSLFERDDRPKAGDFWALRDVSFEVAPGEVVGIIGRNGAGKSTLLKILSRITDPTVGSIRIRGRVASLLEVGTGFHQELTGRENVFLNGAILGMTRSEIRAKFDEIVAFAEIDKFLDTPVKRYSSGMYVRLAFAVAAHLEPEILIVDEVLAVGDAEFQKKCLGKMHQVSQREGRTVLFVSHNMTAVRELCNRGLVLDGGHVAADGSVMGCVEHYVSLVPQTAHLSNHHSLRISNERFSGTDQHGLTLVAHRDRDIVFEAEVSAHLAAKNAWLNLEIFSMSGLQLVHIRNDFDGVNIPLGPEPSLVRLHIHDLPLLPDSYSLRIRLVGDIGGERHIFDTAFYILDIKGSKPGKGEFAAFVDVRHGWEVRQSNGALNSSR